MLQAPVSETKNHTAQGKKPSADSNPQPQWHTLLAGDGAPATAKGNWLMLRRASKPQVSSQAQTAYGNQVVLRTLKSARSLSEVLQRKCACNGDGASCEAYQEKERPSVQRQAIDRDKPQSVPLIVNEVLRAGGQPLSSEVRVFMEERFGQDFGSVRVHTDSRAAESARAVNALAYTVSNEIVFGTGQYSPETLGGKRLLAHELSHVVQQQGTGLSPHGDTISSANDPSEQEAEHTAEQVMAGSSFGVLKAGKGLQRYSHNNCSDDDLRSHVWPSDHTFRQMLAKAIRVLRTKPSDPAVTPLLLRHFRSATPSITTILEAYDAIQTDITANSYTYECEGSCSEVESAYVRHRLRYFGYTPTIHLCIPVLRGYARDCIASIILHEFAHYSAHVDDESGCYLSCSMTGCPAGFSTDDALDNASSYANFAFELYPMSI